MNWDKAGWTSAGTFCCAAAANTLNQVYEVTNDRLMKRTSRRPLPLGKLTRGHALAFAGCVGLAGISILATQVGSPSSRVQCSRCLPLQHSGCDLLDGRTPTLSWPLFQYPYSQGFAWVAVEFQTRLGVPPDSRCHCSVWIAICTDLVPNCTDSGPICTDLVPICTGLFFVRDWART